MRLSSLFLWILGSILLAPPASGQDMAVPAEVQVPLFLKILTLDRQLEATVGDEIVIGVVHQPQIRESWRALQAFTAALEASPIRSVKGRPVRTVPLVVENVEALRRAVAEQEVDVLYVTPLRAVEVRDVAALARDLHFRTLTGVPTYVAGGLAVGIGLKGQRPEILVNLEAAAAEGADYNSQFLRLARVVGD